MALKLSKKLNNGLVIENTYCKICSIYNLDKEQMVCNVSFSKDKDSSPFYSENRAIHYTVEGENPFIQAYEHIKTLEDFKDSEDC